MSDALLAWWQKQPRNERQDASLVKRIRRLYADRPLADVTADSVAEALACPVAGTYNRLVAIVLAALNIAKKRGWIADVPHIEMMANATKRDRFLTRAEWLRLRAELPPHQQDMAEFALATGLRRENVLGLEWSRVDLGRKVAWIYADQFKGRRNFSVPLSDVACDVIRRQVGNHDVYVFTYRGQRIKQPDVGFNRAAERAGLHDVTFHTLRHTWASWHVMAGTPLPVLQALGGWATIGMVQRYAHLAPDHVASWANNIAQPGQDQIKRTA